MQLNELLDQLESAVAEAYYIPMTSKAVVDQNLCLDLLDRIRAELPTELAEAQRIISARDRILTQAEAEAQELRQLGRQQLEQAAAESEAVALANEQAEEIVAEGERQAREMAATALDYTSSIYKRLENDLASLLEELRFRVPDRQTA